MSEATEITHHKSKGWKGVEVCHRPVPEGLEGQGSPEAATWWRCCQAQWGQGWAGGGGRGMQL